MKTAIPSLKAVAVLCDDTIAQTQAEALSAVLDLPLVVPEQADTFPYVLLCSNEGLALQQTGKKADGPVRVDFSQGASLHRRTQGGGELIVKAVGGSAKQRPHVLDVTAGLGRDSFVLASWGCRVTALERSPIIYQLLCDGLERARCSGDKELMAVVERIQLLAVDAHTYIPGMRDAQPDVVLIDPMFPPSKKSALVKKDMRAFHAVVGEDADSDGLLALALEYCLYRVVVKRPLRSEPLAGKQPSFTVSGKAIRFDIYTKKAFPA